MARLHVGLLSEAHSMQDILKGLDALPKGINETYDEIMNRIKTQRAKEANLAKRVLGWITYAKEPLTTNQLQQALTIMSDSTGPDEDAEIHEQILVSACLGIVTIDSKSNIIRLVHYTTQEYMEGIRATQFAEAQSIIAKTCLTCLGFDIFAPLMSLDEELDEEPYNFNDSDSELDDRDYEPDNSFSFKFVRYASRFWVEHVNDIGEKSDVQEAVFRVLSEKRKRDAIYSLDESRRVPRDGTLLHAIGYYGLAITCQIILLGRHNLPEWYELMLNYS